MATEAVFYYQNLFQLYNSIRYNLQDSQEMYPAIVSSQEGCKLITGHVGDESEKDLPTDFTDSIETPELLVKCWTNEDKTVLKAVAVFSKYRTPPPLNEALNQKYLNVLDQPNGLQLAYDLLKENPRDNPLVPYAVVTKRVGGERAWIYDGLVDLRRELKYRVKTPLG